MHEGTVEAFSNGPGTGSEFVVRLPAGVVEAADTPDVTPRASVRSDASPCRILVVDDNVDAAQTLGMLLRLGGHEVRMAHDGSAALDVAPGFSPDVVLLDIGLPGLDGYEVARRLRRLPETEASLLVAVSGYGQDEDRRRAREAGFDHHLTKPVDFAVLKGVLPRQPSHAAAG
jgi:two-component system CheB/CheR fusion protein